MFAPFDIQEKQNLISVLVLIGSILKPLSQTVVKAICFVVVYVVKQ